MKWYNLKLNKCPKCSSYLTGETDATILICSKPLCGFKIGVDRFTELSNEVPNRNNSDRQDSGWGRFDS